MPIELEHLTHEDHDKLTIVKIASCDNDQKNICVAETIETVDSEGNEKVILLDKLLSDRLKMLARNFGGL